MLFTNTPVYVDTAATPPIYLLPANPQIQNQYIITDTVNWVKVGGIFTAQGGAKFNIGYLKNNTQTNYQIVNSREDYFGTIFL
ncbi:MAG: hypothetical protein IT251_07160 [Chitinophagaceae bacterium]|nr:hypothetical protein [Chitinophagaceae bacterium]